MIKTEYRNRLPHSAPIGATFFVTFRLADSLPQTVVAELKREYDRIKAKLQKEKPPGWKELLLQVRKRFFGKYDHQLDQLKYGECYLQRKEVAQIMVDRLQEFNGEFYDLLAFCIMPNHVHILIDTSIQIEEEKLDYLDDELADYVQLDRIMQRIKGGSARFINLLLGRTGSRLWKKDSYDHYVRNEEELWNIIAYILENPVKAGLVERWEDWEFTFLKPVSSVFGD